MAYVRFSREPGQTRASDVQVFMHDYGWLQCQWCGLNGGDSYQAFSTAAMAAHLREHIARGHYVPDYVIGDIQADDAENFPA